MAGGQLLQQRIQQQRFGGRRRGGGRRRWRNRRRGGNRGCGWRQHHGGGRFGPWRGGIGRGQVFRHRRRRDGGGHDLVGHGRRGRHGILRRLGPGRAVHPHQRGGGGLGDVHLRGRQAHFTLGQQRLCRGRVVQIGGDDGGGNHHRNRQALFIHRWLGQQVLAQAGHHGVNAGGAGGRQGQREAAQPDAAAGVFLANAGAKQPRHLQHQRVGHLPPVVKEQAPEIDDLQARHAQLRAVPARIGDVLLQPFDEAAQVGQAGQRVHRGLRVQAAGDALVVGVGAGARHQVHGGEGLGDEIGRAQVQRAHARRFVVLGAGHHDHRHRGQAALVRATHPAKQVVAVRMGHVEVGEDHLDAAVLAQRLPCLDAVVGRHHVELVAEHLVGSLAHQLGIVHHQDAGFAHRLAVHRRPP